MDAVTFQDEAMKLQRLLYRISWSILSNNEDCADAVQEALTRAWQKRGTLKSMDSFKPWLTRILTNVCNDMLRKRQNRKHVPIEDVPVAYEPDMTPQPFEEALQLLSPEHRTVTLLHYLEGYSIKEIARMLAIPSGTVKSRLMYARQRLKSLLSEEWEEV